METLAEQPGREKLKTFDPLASFHMLRFDLQQFGEVLPETLERVQHEELSYLMEGVNRAARSSFVLQREGTELLYFSRGQWRPYSDMLYKGLEAEKQAAASDFRRKFLVDRAVDDIANYNQMRKLQPSEKYSWYSAFPSKESARYGDTFLQQVGFNPGRKMGFLYLASCDEDGRVTLETQTVDNSDDDAFVAAMEVYESVPNAGLDDMVRSYDESMAEKQGGWFYAGRRDEVIRSNAYDTILEQRDLAEYLLDGLVQLASQDGPLDMAEKRVKKHVYGVWAAFKKRIDGEADVLVERSHTGVSASYYAMLHQEVQMAFTEFANRGEVLTGCGGSISETAEEAVLNASGSEAFSAIFGKNGNCEFTSKECPLCHKKNVRTVVKRATGGKKHIKGSCGCTKIA